MSCVQGFSVAERLCCGASSRDEVGSPQPAPRRQLSPRGWRIFQLPHLCTNLHPNLYLPKDASTCTTASIRAPPAPSSAELYISWAARALHTPDPPSRLHPPSLLSAPFPCSVVAESYQFCLWLPPRSPRSHSHRLLLLPRFLESFLNWPPSLGPSCKVTVHCPRLCCISLLERPRQHCGVGCAGRRWTACQKENVSSVGGKLPL